MTKQELLDGIAQERARLLNAIDSLGASASTVIVTDEGVGWTAKDVLAHHIHYMEQIAFGLGVAGLLPPQYVVDNAARRPSGEEWNELAVGASRSVPIADIRQRFEGLADAIVEQVGRRSDEELDAAGAIPWAGQQPLGQLIAGDTTLHWALHRAEIERAARRSG